MKTRNGFVSNSSSSSFIVGFDRVPKTKAELKAMMFYKEETSVQPFDFYEPLSVDAVVDRVFRDLKAQNRPLNKKEIFREMTCGYFEGFPEFRYNEETESKKIVKDYELNHGGRDIYENRKSPEFKAYQKAYQKACQKEDAEREKQIDIAAKRYFEKEYPKFKNKKVYVFSYSDNHGEGELEHGEIFSKLTHLQISHH